MKIIYIKLVLILTFGFFISCNEDDSNNCSDLICTTEFKIITTSVMNADSEIVILDDFKVIDSDNEEDVTISESLYSLELAQETGQYPIVADGSIELNKKRKMTFIGFINNQEVIRSSYEAEEECCGVNLISGNLDLIIE